MGKGLVTALADGAAAPQAADLASALVAETATAFAGELWAALAVALPRVRSGRQDR